MLVAMLRSAQLRFIGIACCLLVCIPISEAQPGAQPPAPRPQSSPGPSPYGPYNAAPNYSLLTAEERELLLTGEISSGQTIGGGAVAWILGFGAGHAVQGRYEDVGWKFTLGEAASVAGIIVGLSIALDHESRYPSDTGENILVASFVSLAVLRIWETIDAFTGPGQHNQKYRAAHWKAYGTPPQRYGLYLAPTRSGGGGVAGARLQF